MLKYFFISKENLPSGLGFSLYDRCHLIWLSLIFLFILIMAIKSKNMSSQKKEITRKMFGILNFFLEIIYQVILIFTHQYNMNYLPLHLCGITAVLCIYDSFCPNNLFRNFLYCTGMPGCFMALMFPNWTMCPILNFNHIISFVSHGLLIAYPIYLMFSGQFTPSYKKLPMCGTMLLTFVVPIYFFNKIFDTNFFFINTPSEGSPLIALENWLGNPGYIFGMLMMVLICWGIMYIPVLIKEICEKDEVIEI